MNGQHMEHSIYFGDGTIYQTRYSDTKSFKANSKYVHSEDSSLFTPYQYEANFRPQHRGLIRGANTWEDWHLIPTSRPEIVPPEVYTNYVDLPAVHGKLDLSEYLTGGPVYKNRSGSLEFIAANGYGFWAERYNQINNFLHGRKLYMVLYDEPEYFYTGRFRVEKYESDGSTNWSTVNINYELDPFKFLLPDPDIEGAQGYWDRFLFEDIHPYQFMDKVPAKQNGESFSIPGYPNGFMIDAFIDDSSTFLSDGTPLIASVTLNGKTLTLSKTKAGVKTVKTGSLDPVINSMNKVTVKRLQGSIIYVDIVCYGGSL